MKHDELTRAKLLRVACSSSNNAPPDRSQHYQSRYCPDSNVVVRQDDDIQYGRHVLCALPDSRQFPRTQALGVAYQALAMEYSDSW